MEACTIGEHEVVRVHGRDSVRGKGSSPALFLSLISCVPLRSISHRFLSLQILLFMLSSFKKHELSQFSLFLFFPALAFFPLFPVPPS